LVWFSSCGTSSSAMWSYFRTSFSSAYICRYFLCHCVTMCWSGLIYFLSVLVVVYTYIAVQ
jgi:hypothetical protein